MFGIRLPENFASPYRVSCHRLLETLAHYLIELFKNFLIFRSAAIVERMDLHQFTDRHDNRRIGTVPTGHSFSGSHSRHPPSHQPSLEAIETKSTSGNRLAGDFSRGDSLLDLTRSQSLAEAAAYFSSLSGKTDGSV